MNGDPDSAFSVEKGFSPFAEMGNSWQSKCETFWKQSRHPLHHTPPPPPPHEASSLLNSHTQGSMLLTSKTIQDHLLSNMHGLDKLELADYGTSFLSLVSGPLLHVPCDKRQLVDTKPVSATNLDSSNCRTGNCFSQGSSVSWPCNMDCPNLTSREAFSPLTLSNTNVNGSLRSILYQSVNSNLQKSHAVQCHHSCEKDKPNSSCSLISNNNATPASANSLKLQKYAHITSLPKTPVESIVSAYSHGYNHSSSLLRVFCSGTSGNLLLSDTGLLGVVCACHGLFMSVSKFSEHSGSCDVNPGIAVRMDSGETLAHWWKNFFSKTGIKVVEGQRGWDWPDGISVASGLRNHPIVRMSNNPVMLDQVGPFKASVSYKQQNHGEIYSKESQCHQNIVDKYLYHERDRTSQECTNSILKYLMNGSHGSMQHAAGQPICGLPNSFSAHTEKASHSTSDELGSVCTSANSFPARPYIEGVGVGTETSFIVKRPGISSNFELRLGQPPERIQTLDTKDQPFHGSIVNGMHAEASEVCFTDKLLQKKSNELQGSGSSLQFSDISSNLTERRVSTLLEHSCVGGAYGAKTDSQKDLLNASLEMNDVNSLLIPCIRNPGTKRQFSNVNDNSSDSHVSKKLQCGYHSFESEKVSLRWSSVAAKVKEFGTDVSNAFIIVNKGKEVECTMNTLLGPPKPNNEFSKGFKEDQSSFNLVLGDTLSNYSPAFHEKGFNSQQMPAMIADESYGRDVLNNGRKIPSLSDIMHFNHDHIKPIHNSIVSKDTAPLGFSSKTSAFALNVTPTLSKERPSGIKNGLQYENVEMPVVWEMLSDGNNGPASVRSLQEGETTKNHCAQSLLTIAPLILKGHNSLLDSSRMPKNSETEEKPTLPGKCLMGHNNERFGTVAGRSLYTEDPNLTSVQQLFVRPRGTECNFTQNDKEHCFQGSTFPFVTEKCSTAAQENNLAAKYDLNFDNWFNLVRNGDKIGGATSLPHSKLNENCIFLTETAKSFGKTESLVAENIKSAESRAFQWRDVPKKLMESSSSTRKEEQVGSFNQSLGNPAADVAKGFVGFARNVAPLTEQDIFNVSSGCSALDVSQSSIEVNKNDSSTIEGANIRYPNNLFLDEVSGNDRSWSTDDALKNFRSASMVNLIKREPSKVVPKKQSLCLIEEIRLQNSLRPKNLPHNINISSTVGEESDNLQEFELEPKKRRKMVKWMKLDVPVSVPWQSSVNDESPKCAEEVGQNVHSFCEVQRSIRCDQGRPNNCPYLTEQSGKQRNSAFSAVKGTSQRKNLLNFYHQYEQQTTEGHTSSLTEDTFRESAGCKKKRLLLDDASALCNEIQEICCNSAELTAKSLGGHSNSPSKPNFYNGKVRPTVFGRYGIISNGNPLKPAKIVQLREIHRNSDKSNRNADDRGKLKPRAAKVKKAKVRHVMETALGKKSLRSQGRPHNCQPTELKCYDVNWDLETASCSATSGSYNPLYTSQKCDDHVVERKPSVQPKTKFKECRKRSLHELLIKAGRCCGELIEKAVDDRTQTNEMNNGTRCSEKHQSENADMFRCATQDSDKDEYNQLLQCSRFLTKQMNTDSKGILLVEAISPHNDIKNLQPGGNFSTCARTEGYKGRKSEGFSHNHPQDIDGNGGCLVPQEQLNAWLHIHRQKPQGKGRPKLSCSNVESDFRIAYARYKHSKSWKILVVYKSGIHALGLYTSQFISRGAMVVEYVGEIVGLRVADRREGEYHSGKKIQHKSACYFFRIDKEHIIDATRKGGIARFVNHSCQPNCVAKVISVRTEKKVVFFAERDIYPGEEITYDYHFNHEDEGEKIPCLCKSKNCRRYLN